MIIFILRNQNGRKPNNLRLEMIILRSLYNEEERENIEMLSKDSNLENNLLLQYMRTSLSQKTANFSCAVAMLICGVMRRGTSYLYRFSTNFLTRADFSWGSNIIYILSFLLLAFLPKVYIVLLGFV